MLILLPPSETKATGGSLPPLAIERLSGSSQLLTSRLVELSADVPAATKALKLGPKQLGDIERNSELFSSPTMPAILRYTGVLFDALKADSDFDIVAASAGRVMIQSSLFGLIDAAMPIPYYRFSAGSKLAGINLKKHWQQAQQEMFLGLKDELLIDLRSKAYQELAPIPAGIEHYSVDVLVGYPDGTKKPLNHFNKKAKGVFTREALRTTLATLADLELAANKAGINIEISDHQIELVVASDF